MIHWIKKRLGITALENDLNMLRKLVVNQQSTLSRMSVYLGRQQITGRKSQRYDEIERARSLRRKGK